MDTICNAVEKLAVTEAMPSVASDSAPASDFSTGVREAVSSFETLKDMGLFAWHTQPISELKSHAYVTEHEIRSRLDMTAPAAPRLKVDSICLPVRLSNGTKQLRVNRFPNDPGVAAALAAAAAKGVDARDIDFVLGGSSMHVLAGGSTEGNVYLAQRVGSAIVLAKHAEYTADLGSKGFQFERLITGESPNRAASPDVLIGMQLAKVGSFRVLFQAEVDALDTKGDRVEAKSGNPNRFGVKEMFQMVSSRSGTLVFADCRGDTLKAIRTRSLTEVADWTPKRLRHMLETNLLESMAQLKSSSLPEDVPSQLAFEGGKVTLTPRPDLSILPNSNVIEALLDTRCV